MNKLRSGVTAAAVFSLLVANTSFAQPSRGTTPTRTGTVTDPASVGSTKQVPTGVRLSAPGATRVPPAAQRSLPKPVRALTSAQGETGDEEIPFRPTMDEAEYRAAKDAASTVPMPASRSSVPQPLASLAPVTLSQGPFRGTDQSNSPFGVRPPDTHMAAGGGVSQQLVEIGNNFITVFDRSGNVLLSTSLNAFMGTPPPVQFGDTLFDPRVVYDQTWNRWVVTADAFPNSSRTQQLFYVAASATDDATGPFFIYAMNTVLNPGDLFDFPQLGMDQDAVIITANVFGTPVFRGAYAFGIAKARLYNGLPWSVPVFTGLCATLTPPIVQDQSATAYLACAGGNRASIPLFAMQDAERPNATTLVLQANVPVAAYTIPPSATQPRTFARVDTLDARFANASAQVGNFLYQVHTVNFNGFPTPKWYRINTASNAAEIQDFFFASDSSNDWNASIAANANDEVFVTWSSDDPGRTGGVNPEIRISGRQPGDTGITPGTSIAVSETFSTQFRWGDYSAVSLDPVGTGSCAPNRSAWAVNEIMLSQNFWGSEFAQMGFC